MIVQRKLIALEFYSNRFVFTVYYTIDPVSLLKRGCFCLTPPPPPNEAAAVQYVSTTVVSGRGARGYSAGNSVWDPKLEKRHVVCSTRHTVSLPPPPRTGPYKGGGKLGAAKQLGVDSRGVNTCEQLKLLVERLQPRSDVN